MTDISSLYASCKQVTTFLGTGSGVFDSSLLSLCGTALIASTTIIVFIYVWGNLMRNPSLMAYAKSEIYELVISVILAIFLIGAVSTLSSTNINGYLPQSNLPKDIDQKNTNIYVATCYFYESVTSEMQVWLNANYFLGVVTDYGTAFTKHARPMGIGAIISPFVGFFSPLKQLIYNTSSALAVAMLMNYIQKFVFFFTTAAFVRFYLPLGILLRCFTPTRKIGGTLIGIAATFLFVFPALSVISYSMFFSDNGPLLSFRSLLTDYFNDKFDVQGAGGSFSRVGNFLQDSFTTNGEFSFVSIVAGPFGIIGRFLQGVVGGAFLTFLIIPAGIISFSFAIGFVIPIFNVIVYTQVARGLSRSFGEDVDITSLTRLI